VITPYKQQYFQLKRTFAAALDKATFNALDINTVVRAAAAAAGTATREI
jgi:hypothetical protein